MATIINVEFGRHRSVSETVNVANGTTEIVETQSGNELTDEQRYELAKKAERVHRAKMATKIINPLCHNGFERFLPQFESLLLRQKQKPCNHNGYRVFLVFPRVRWLFNRVKFYSIE